VSIRPIDMQVNIGRESDVKTQRIHDEIREEGAQRYATELQKEEQIKSENVQDTKKSEMDKIEEKNKKKKKEDNKKKKKDKKKEEFSDPTKGSIIDIKLV
jgi:hypothetical protein